MCSPEIPEDMCLPSFTQLESLVFTHRFMDLWPPMHSSDIPYHKTVRAAIAANSATLRRLDVFGEVLWGCPPSSFSNLLELTIVFPNSLDGLGPVFEHCRALVGFTLCTENEGADLADVLKAYPEAFPNITSFKLLSVFDLLHEVADDIAKFLKRKKLLRRVDILTRTEVSAGEALANLAILKILPELPRLEVLGLDIRPAKLTAAHVKLLQQYVPSRVTALFLLFQSDSSDAKVADWRNFVSETLLHPPSASPRLSRVEQSDRCVTYAAFEARRAPLPAHRDAHAAHALARERALQAAAARAGAARVQQRHALGGAPQPDGVLGVLAAREDVLPHRRGLPRARGL